MKISVNSITKSYSGSDLFTDLSFEINPGNRLAVTGPNGCGKSTLLKMLCRVLQPDSGSISIPRGMRTGFVAQDFEQSQLDSTLLEFVLDAIPDWGDFWRKWTAAIASGDDRETARLAHIQAEMEDSYGYSPEYKAEKILAGLGFDKKSLNKRLCLFSGGWRERAKLSRVLLQGADVLILDEPTNHLDLEAVLWLEQYLVSFPGMVVLVAHDRYFLDRVATHVLHLGFDRPYFRPGNYSDFLRWHQQRELQKEKEKEKIADEIKHLKSFVDRFRYKATKARQAQARIGRMDKLSSRMDDLAGDVSGKTLNFTWPDPVKPSRVAVTCADLCFAHDKSAPVFSEVSFQLFNGQKIALAGPNGSGKSTLLKLITGAFSPNQGQISLGKNTRPGYFAQHQTEALVLENTVLAEIRRLGADNLTEEEIRSVLGLFMLDETFWQRSVASLSGGEKSRLILASLFLTRANLFLLDEPTNHLDMETREALVAALKDFPGAVMVIAHDRYFLSQVAREVWSVQEQGIVQHGTGFEEYYARLLAKDSQPQDSSSGGKKHAEPCSQKEKRRQEAEIRNRIYQQLKPLKKEYSDQEARLESGLERQEEVEAILAMPETYSDQQKFMELTREYQNLVDENEVLMLKMEDLEQKISRLEADRP